MAILAGMASPAHSRRRLIAMKKLFQIAAVFLVLGSMPIAHAQEEKPASLTYVIVHGATAGGWEWKDAGKALTEKGHTVYRATLTGLGERRHLANAEVNLTTHVDDVVNLILFEDLHDVVLAGHSYGGTVITGVMDRVPERIRHVMFLDAMVPEDGESAFDVVGGLPPSATVEDGLARFPGYNPNAKPPHGVPHPVKTFSEPVSYKKPEALALPVTYVAFVPASQSKENRAATDKSWKRATARGWTIRTLEGTHVAHVTKPKEVAEVMVEAVGDKNRPTEPAAKAE